MLSLIQNKYYIVRLGDFATNGNTKLIYGLFSILLCIDDYISRNSEDCFIILIGSTIIWTIVELYLHISQTRVIKPMYITLCNNKYQLSQPPAIILQGLQEGGLITTLGLYFGDRITEIKYIIVLHLFILCTIINIFMKKNIIKASKRQVNTITCLSFIGMITVYDIRCVYLHPEQSSRQFSMFFIMIYICSFWTFFTWYNGFRTIEIHINDSNNDTNNDTNISNCNTTVIQTYNIKPITNIDTFYILAYDVIFEIGIAYMLFYNLFIPY